MSDTRSTLTDRSSSILSKDHPPDKRSKSDKLPGTPTHDFDPTGLVQRCVIIQKDENGFGLTVSGDNPVFVQLVKQDGAAMRAGVQTGDRIIKVNGTLVTHSNHVEVVKLIKSGSYVALTVLGRPPGLPQVPLPELDLCREETFVTTPDSYSATERTSSLVSWEESSVPHNQRLDNKRIVSREQQDMQGLKDEHNKTSKPLWDVQEAKMHIPHPLNRATHEGLYLRNTEDGCWTDEDKGDLSPVQRRFYPASPVSQRDSNCSSPKSTPRDSLNSCPSPDVDDRCDLDSRLQTSVRSPPSRQTSEIIVLEDEDFDTEQEQVNGQCSCFQDIELLKTRPAHLAVFLHHVISQFDPAPLLCYLYADLYKHTNSKEARRIFTDFLGFFIDRGAHLKVAVPESISYELERRRLELIPEELHRQYIQTMQETLLPDVQRHLEDFRQKRNMGLTLAEVELARLDSEHLLVERERACAENILSKIDDVLVTSQPTEEEKCTTMQYVIYTYMKHLGLRVKEHRILESKRPRIHFLPSKLRKSKTEKEGEEKLKKPRFPIRVPPRWPVRIESIAGGKAGESFKQRPQKQMSQPAMGGSEPIEGGRLRGSQSSEGSDLLQSPGIITSPPFSSPYSSPSDPSGRETEFSMSPSAVVPRLSDGLQAGDVLDSIYPPCDYIPYSVDPLDEDREGDRLLDVGTPKLIRRFEELQSEDDQGSDVYSDVDPPNWQQLVGRDVLAGLTPHEIKRQEVINELFYTERAHVRMLKVLDRVFYQKLNRDNILPPADIKNIFTNLEDIIQLHMRIADHMTAIRKKYESSVIDHIGDELLSWFSGGEEEMIKHAVCTFCSNQPFALELIKSRQKKDQRFTTFMQEAESNRLCRRLQLKDIIPAEMQRFTKYPLLMDNIAKYTDEEEEKDKVRRAAECCRKILNHVNQSVKESENKQRLEDYQRRLDLSSLKQSENPMISEFKNLDLTKRKMVHEGPLSWKINKDKTIELYTLLLEDILVLLQKQDERLILRCQSKNLAGTADTKHIFSPIIKLSTVLVRSVATDNRSFFVISMSENGAQIYELMAQTVSDQRMWQRQISQRADVMKAAKIHSVILLPQSDGDRDSVELSKFSKGSDRISTGSVQSAEKDFSPSAALRDCVPDTSEEDRVQRAGRDGSYLVSELMNDKDTDSIASSSKADEALKTLAALKQVLVTQLMAQDEGEHLGRSAGSRLLRTTSLRTPVEHSSIRTPSRAQDYTSGDTGFYECPEDYAAYLVLEGYGGSGESSTDDDIQVGRKELGLAHSCAADSGISLKFSSPSSGSTSRLSRQVLSHLRSLQANLNHLKEMETKYYNLLRQRPVGSTTDTDESRDKK
ncbi:rho guanine nucleotide exchange factor 12 isoform X4 [Triplophysa rosa]|uniref:rho guanine nucleotide exchange factor 12 isoform X4 n=1 Tax=Triplophysa rosa TaxID=992332 RepID=UPI0025462072|nr:rho guanine nucleotide exchange factor 12 isoform X4 [Triplophysa rosa]